LKHSESLAFAAIIVTIVDQIQLLEEADKNRRAFIANVSHDLRTPLAATQGYIELMLHKNERCSVEQREEYLGIALKHSNRLKVSSGHG